VIEKESCPLCDLESRSGCSYCNGTGEVELLQLEGALYKANCACGLETTAAWDVVGPLDFAQTKCKNCQVLLKFEFVGWGLTGN